MSERDKLLPSTKEHLRRMDKSIAATLPYSNYEPGFQWYHFEGDYQFYVVLLAAFLNGVNVGDGYCKTKHFCIAEGLGEEYVVQFVRRPEVSGYVNIGLTAESEPAAGNRTRSRIRISLDATVHKQVLHKKVMKFNGFTYDMPGFQMELLGDYDPGQNSQWNDISSGKSDQGFNFRIDQNSDFCIRFTRKHGLRSNGNHTLVTNTFLQKPFEMEFGIEHENTPRLETKSERAQLMEFQLRQQQLNLFQNMNTALCNLQVEGARNIRRLAAGCTCSGSCRC